MLEVRSLLCACVSFCLLDGKSFYSDKTSYIVLYKSIVVFQIGEKCDERNMLHMKFVVNFKMNVWSF